MPAIRSFTIILQFLVLTTVVFGLNQKLLDSIEDNHAERKCLKLVFDEYVQPLLSSTNSNGKILVNLPSSKSTLFYHDYVLKLFHQKFPVIVTTASNEHKNLKIDSEIGIYVLFCTYLAEVTDAIERWKSSIETWNSNASVFIFLKDTSESYLKIRQILMDSNLLNVNLISIGTKKIEIETSSNSGGGGGCGKYIRNLQVVAECILESASFRAIHHELEKNKISVNVHKRCPLNVLTLEWSPFTFFSSKLGSYTGFEAELLKTIADKIQFEPVLISLPNNSREIITDFIRNGRADLIIGGLSSDVSDYRDLSSSVAYSSDDISWCIAAAKQIPRWQNIFLIAPVYIWVTIFALTYVGGFVLYILLKHDPGTYHSYHVVCLIMLQTVLGLPNYFNPKSSYVRLFYALPIFAGIVGMNTLLAFAIRYLFLTIYMEQIDSMDEIVSNGYKLCGQNETLSFYNYHQDSVSSYVQQTYHKCTRSIDYNLAELATSNNNLAVAVSRLHANNCPLIASNQLFCLPNENIINFPIAMIFRRDFYLLPKFNEILQHATEAGLVQKWKNDFKMYNFKPTENNENIVLTLEHLLGAFVLWGVCLLLALLQLLAENLMYSYMISKRSDKKSSFWCTIERCVCIPERVYFLQK